MAIDQPHQMILGLFVLLLVDVIWVASSELSEYIFKDIGFNKPFFSTYTKTSLFSVYLLGFLVWPSWRRQCCNSAHSMRYMQLSDDGNLTPYVGSDGNEETSDDREGGSEDDGENTRLSSPQFEPVKMADTDKSSDGETDDSGSVKSVRFNRVAEVRQMPESHGVEALLSRLSFSAALRAQQHLHSLQSGVAAALPVREVAAVALAFCVLWFMGNYSYQMALSLSHSGVTNVVSSTSGLFTLLLAAVFPSSSSDAFTVSKLMTVLAMLAGVAMVSVEDFQQHHNATTTFLTASHSPPDFQLLKQPLYHHHHHYQRDVGSDVLFGDGFPAFSGSDVGHPYDNHLKDIRGKSINELIRRDVRGAPNEVDYGIDGERNYIDGGDVNYADGVEANPGSVGAGDEAYSNSELGNISSKNYVDYGSSYNIGGAGDRVASYNVGVSDKNYSSMHSGDNNENDETVIGHSNKQRDQQKSHVTGTSASPNSTASVGDVVMNHSKMRASNVGEDGGNGSGATTPIPNRTQTSRISTKPLSTVAATSATQSNSDNFGVRNSLQTTTSSGGAGGVWWALGGAVLYACYMVFLRRRVRDGQRLDIAMFFGFVGLFNTVLLWPGLFLLHITGWETLTLPTVQQALYITANGLVGTVLSELLWLWGCFLTSSLVATLSLSLTIPLSMAADVLLRGVRYSWLFYAGSAPIVLSFVVVTLLTHYDNWDPLGGLCCRGSQYSSVSTDVESESLIVPHGSDESNDDDDENEDVHFSAASYTSSHFSADTVLASPPEVAHVDASSDDTDARLTNGKDVSVSVSATAGAATSDIQQQQQQQQQNAAQQSEDEKETDEPKDLIDMEADVRDRVKHNAERKVFKSEAMQALMRAALASGQQQELQGSGAVTLQQPHHQVRDPTQNVSHHQQPHHHGAVVVVHHPMNGNDSPTVAINSKDLNYSRWTKERRDGDYPTASDFRYAPTGNGNNTNLNMISDSKPTSDTMHMMRQASGDSAGGANGYQCDVPCSGELLQLKTLPSSPRIGMNTSKLSDLSSTKQYYKNLNTGANEQSIVLADISGGRGVEEVPNGYGLLDGNTPSSNSVIDSLIASQSSSSLSSRVNFESQLQSQEVNSQPSFQRLPEIGDSSNMYPCDYNKNTPANLKPISNPDSSSHLWISDAFSHPQAPLERTDNTINNNHFNARYNVGGDSRRTTARKYEEEDETLEIIRHEDNEIITSQLIATYPV